MGAGARGTDHVGRASAGGFVSFPGSLEHGRCPTHMLGSGAYTTTTCGVPQELCGSRTFDLSTKASQRAGRGEKPVNHSPRAQSSLEPWHSDGPSEPASSLGPGFAVGGDRARSTIGDPQLVPSVTRGSCAYPHGLLRREISAHRLSPGSQPRRRGELGDGFNKRCRARGFSPKGPRVAEVQDLAAQSRTTAASSGPR